MSQQQEIMNNLLIEAVRNRDVAQAKLYVQKGADPNCSATNIPVNEKTSIVHSFSRSVSGPVLHLAGCTGAFSASGNGFSRDMTDFLIAAGARVDAKNSDGNTMLMVAVKSYSSDMVKYWLGKGANPLETDARGNMVIKLASDIDSSAATRQTIINALMAKIPDTQPQNASTPLAAPGAVPGAVSVPAATRDIAVMKPAAVVARRTPNKPRGGGGFTL